MAQVAIVFFLAIVFAGCKSASGEREAAALIAKANGVLDQTTKTTKEWTTEYGRAFAPQNRAQFPANRGLLQTSADKIVRILDEETRVSNQVIQQYEQAIALMNDEQKRRAVGLLISALRTTLHSYEFLKSQMRLVSDELIVDAKTFEEKFLRLGEQFGKSLREGRAQFDEGRRLLGIK